MNPENLPQNWRKNISKSHPGKCYYFNIITGESRWQPPKNEQEFKDSEVTKTQNYVSSSSQKTETKPSGNPKTNNIAIISLKNGEVPTEIKSRKRRNVDDSDEDHIQVKRSFSVNDRLLRLREELQSKRIAKDNSKQQEDNTIKNFKEISSTQNDKSNKKSLEQPKSGTKNELISTQIIRPSVTTSLAGKITKPTVSASLGEPNTSKSAIIPTEKNNRKKFSINDRFSKFRQELANKHNPSTIIKNILSSYEKRSINLLPSIQKKKKNSTNDRLLKLKEMMQSKPHTTENINEIINVNGNNMTKLQNSPNSHFTSNSTTELNKNLENRHTIINTNNEKVKTFSVNDRLKKFQELLGSKRNLGKVGNSETVSDDTKNPIQENDDDIEMEEDERCSNVTKSSEKQLTDFGYTPMEWEYIDQEIDRNIEEIRSQPPTENVHTLSEYYDVVDKNLFKLFAEKNETKITYEEDKYHFVIDTNVFLKDLNFLNELIELKSCDTKIILIVPYVVLQELDYLKIRTNQAVSTLAVRAIKYLNDKFDEKNLSIRGQSAIEAENKFISISSADDSIINCCLQIKTKTQFVALLTHDINLKNKARSSDIKCFSKDDFENLQIV